VDGRFRLVGHVKARLKNSLSNCFKRLINGASCGVYPRGLRRSCIYQLKGLILAQNERWRRGLGMQVERDRFPHLAFSMEKAG
jgi:hypothetical protein